VSKTEPGDGEGDQYAPSQGPRSDPWRIAQAAAQLGALCLAYRHDEGAALALQALVALIELFRRDEPS
jgi:hypothetical protein